MHFVKHPKYSRNDLNGKRVAYCQKGHPFLGYYFRVGKVRDDGYHELSARTEVLIPMPNSENRLTSSPLVIELDQYGVDKIVIPESGSHLS